jgi:oxygen-independent coproporphyrinogen III oxidase
MSRRGPFGGFHFTKRPAATTFPGYRSSTEAMNAMLADLLQFSDRRIPRYTSYPTAMQFGTAVDGAIYAEWLAALPADLALSIYLHVPFCAELCLYCGCHTTVVRKYTAVAAYADLLEHEIALIGRHLGGRRPVKYVHWGGGTPTMLRATDFARLMGALRRTFSMAENCEIAVEVDPRTLTREVVFALRDDGVTRASLGVQDFDPQVQKAVRRVQSFEQTARAADWLRKAGIANINLDLMYGLPYQTVETVAATAQRAVALNADRIALFGYAHVPWMKRHQKLLPEQALPGPLERFAQSAAAADVLKRAGFQPVGLDHFAKPDDLLARRQREKRLHRNFQGYTTDDATALIGFGTSAIGGLPQGYVQNASSTAAYRDAIQDGCLATIRGRALTEEDRLRRDIIERLMCNLEVDLAGMAAAWNRSLNDFAKELSEIDTLAQRGLVHRSDGTITIDETARPLVRTICAIFDAYLSNQETRYSRAV